MTRVRLSRAAEADLDEIDDKTLQLFGLEQAIRIRESFRETLAILADSPLLAPRRPDYDPPGKIFRYHPVKGFVIVYEPLSDSGIRVARVLHGARLLAAELSRDAGAK